MGEIEQKLDDLAEYQSQIDVLNAEKRELIDQVKIPAEVLAAQDEANKKRQSAQSECWKRIKTIEAVKLNALDCVKDPEMPAEFVAALAEARKRRADIEAEYKTQIDAEQEKARKAAEEVDSELKVQVGNIYDQVAQRKQEIEAEFAGKTEAAEENIKQLQADIRAGVLQAGESKKGTHYQAVYVRGRVTWNTDMLDGMVIAFPALAKARKEGQPSVAIRANGKA